MADNNNGSWLGNALKSAATGLVGGAPGALLSMGTSLIGSIFGNNMNRKNQERTQAWQEKMNLQQQQWQEDMWNMNNAYNSPQAQMQRLQAAGLNPNNASAAILGTNATSQMAQQPTIPNGNPIPGVNVDLVGAMNEGMRTNKEMQLLESQRENIEADTLGKLKNIEGTDAQIKLWQKQGDLMDIDILNKPKEYEAVINQANQLAAKAAADAHLSESEANKLDYVVENILPLEKQLSEGKIQLTQQELKEGVARTASLFAQAALAYAQAKTEGKKQDLLEKQAQGQGIENTIRGIDALFEFGDKLLGRKYTAEQIKNLKFTNSELAYAKKFLAANGVPMSILNSTSLPEFIKLGMLANVEGFGGNAEQIGNLTYLKNTGDELQGLVGLGFQVVGTAIGSVAGGVGAGIGAGVAAGVVSKHIPGAKNAPPHDYQHQGNIPYRNTSTTQWNWNP